MVADWGYLQPRTLELATPCNGGGYAPDCSLSHWAVCPNNEAAVVGWNCYYWSEWDDCEWPKLFAPENVPKVLDIYSQ